MTGITRGIRNNNPGNIDWNKANNWVGQVGIETKVGGNTPRFVVFDSPENGIRALGKLLQTYYNKYGLNTVRKILVRYAPELENDTSAYIRAVADRSGLGPDQKIASIKDRKVLGALMHSIIKHENANYEYSDAVFNEGLRRAVS